MTDLRVEPLTPERWPDLERLFGPRGAVGGCWCMWWRLFRPDYEASKGDANRASLRRLAERRLPPGLIAYLENEPVGWCSIGPRDDYPRLDRSRTLARVDDVPVWSVVCFYVARRARRRGVSRALLAGAVDQARSHGANVVEGYPVDPESDDMPPVFAWTGLLDTFRAAGFEEVARRTAGRPIVRLRLQR